MKKNGKDDNRSFYQKSIDSGWLSISSSGIVARDIVATLLDPAGKSKASSFLKRTKVARKPSE